MRIVDYLDEFLQELRKQLEDDELRYGNTWEKRSIDGQEWRTRKRFDDYFDQFENAGVPVPWLKIAGHAVICWVRERNRMEAKK